MSEANAEYVRRVVSVTEELRCLSDGGRVPNQLCNQACEFVTIRVTVIEDWPSGIHIDGSETDAD